MKKVVTIIAALVAVVGVVWVLQGINILRRSVMSGNLVWTYIGGVMVAQVRSVEQVRQAVSPQTTNKTKDKNIGVNPNIKTYGMKKPKMKSLMESR